MAAETRKNYEFKLQNVNFDLAFRQIFPRMKLEKQQMHWKIEECLLLLQVFYEWLNIGKEQSG